jgi:hypothetical protein
MHDVTTLTPSRQLRWRFRALRWLASKCAKRTICVDGKPYLERYYLAGPIRARTAAFWPENDRPVPRLRWLRRVWYLHRFLAPDADRHLHDHPWDGRGRILAGAYVEEREPTSPGPNPLRVYTEGDKTHVRPWRYHRVLRLLRAVAGDPSEVWTLLRVTAHAHAWGYLKNGQHVPYEIYHATPVNGRRHERTGFRVSL